MTNKKKNDTKINVQQILEAAAEQKTTTFAPRASGEKTEVEKAYEAALNQLTEEHREKGSLAFELLKYAVSSRTESLNGNPQALENLVTSSFILADTFKNEMAKRWGLAFRKTAEKFNPNLTVLDDSQPVESTDKSGKLN